MASPGEKDLARFIDYTFLRPETSRADIERVCSEARAHSFRAVCVTGVRVLEARHFLEESPVQLCAAVGSAGMDADAKRYEVEVAVDQGAQEIEVTINLGRLKDGEHPLVLRELRDLVEASDERPLGVALETHLLTRDEVIHTAQLSVEAGAKWVAASSGFDIGTQLEEVRLLRATVGAEIGVKAAGAIADRQSVLALLDAGATRVGTSLGVTFVR